MDYCVYCHTIPSGRKYVGISCNPEKRWSRGNGYSKNYLFSRAIKKYGWDNITHEILYEGLSLKEAKKIEKQLIADWKLTDSKYGMNLSGGGEGVLSVTTHNLMSKANIGNTRCVGRKLSSQTKEQISKSLKEYYSCHESAFKGKHHSEQTIQKLKSRIVPEVTKEKMRQNHANVSGANNPAAKTIIQMTMDGVEIARFPYAREASEKCGVNIDGIRRCCRGKRQSCGGYKWQYAKDEAE